MELALALLAERLNGPAGADGVAVVTAGGTMLHRPTCAVTLGQPVRPAGPDDAGLATCELCRPVRTGARRPRTRRTTGA